MGLGGVVERESAVESEKRQLRRVIEASNEGQPCRFVDGSHQMM